MSTSTGVNPFPDDARLWNAVDTFRVLALGYAVAVFALTRGEHAHLWTGWAVLGVLTAWTVFVVTTRLRRGRPPTRGLLAADLAVACAAVRSTAAVDSPAVIAAGGATLPGIWAAAPVLAWAVLEGRRAGLAAACCVALADLVEVRRLSASTLDAIVLLLIAGSLLGWAVELLRAGRAELARAVALQAATRERERLAADIHDSVLQVLAYVRRRGAQVGGEAATIGELAGEQEVRLRALVASASSPDLFDTLGAIGPGGRDEPAGAEDVAGSLVALASADVVVTGPGRPVLLPPAAAHAVRGAVRAALDNVRRHAGPQAKAWILLEDEPTRVTVTVRDDGVGFAPGRLEEAVREGRLGVQASVRGRLADVGGTVSVHSAPGEGTEIELVVPRSRSTAPLQ
jgi:signal transduction histidine kinase